jgi:DNA-binding NarL/FixJ family response regulator
MIADGHPSLRLGVRTLLGTNPSFAIVGEAGDAPTVVRLVGELRPDLLILDALLPGLNGFEATRRLARAHPSVKILALSARPEASVAHELREVGAHGVLSKSCSASQFVEAVKLVLAGPPYIAAGPHAGPRARDHATPTAAKLSAREEEVLRLLARGLTMKDVSPQLRLSPRTVETYKTRAMLKLNLKTRADLMRFALQSGWLDLP